MPVQLPGLRQEAAAPDDKGGGLGDQRPGGVHGGVPQLVEHDVVEPVTSQVVAGVVGLVRDAFGGCGSVLEDPVGEGEVLHGEGVAGALQRPADVGH